MPPGGSPDQVALGDRIYHGRAAGGTCAGCHGANGRGSAVGPDLTGRKWLRGDGSVGAITRSITNGIAQPKDHTGAMPPYGGAQLSQADLAAVAECVWAIGHAKTRWGPPPEGLPPIVAGRRKRGGRNGRVRA